ncbi:hypothetical protein EVAR_81419_1 [Eumeta japonica]|uniref:Uncharacterized protein n=1 Tax=Eumeta variegata TaxID=151549 RepID=A0A4C1WHG3_EUMVA|nr:hypothetical protein EVAR_81419_1 [Eumeta japonica]
MSDDWMHRRLLGSAQRCIPEGGLARVIFAKTHPPALPSRGIIIDNSPRTNIGGKPTQFNVRNQRPFVSRAYKQPVTAAPRSTYCHDHPFTIPENRAHGLSARKTALNYLGIEDDIFQSCTLSIVNKAITHQLHANTSNRAISIWKETVIWIGRKHHSRLVLNLTISLKDKIQFQATLSFGGLDRRKSRYSYLNNGYLVRQPRHL